MESNDDAVSIKTASLETVPIESAPIMKQLEGDESPKDAVPIPPWLRRFASVVGLAGAGQSSGNPAMFG